MPPLRITAKNIATAAARNTTIIPFSIAFAPEKPDDIKNALSLSDDSTPGGQLATLPNIFRPDAVLLDR